MAMNRSEARPDLKGWRCGHCVKNNLVIFTTDMTSNCRQHLTTSHRVLFGGVREVEGVSIEEEVVPAKSQLRSLLQVVDIEQVPFPLTAMDR